MVKGYDTTLSDPSKILLDYLFSFWDGSFNRLSVDEASKQIKYWIRKSNSTSWVYKQFQNMQIKPKITIYKRCPKQLLSWAPSQGDKNFPAFIKQDQINICMDNIRNKIQLKQNLDRELYTAYYLNREKQKINSMNHKQEERILMESLFEGCQQGYKNYGWQEPITRRVAKKCAIYLFRRRSTSNLPPDSLFRYSSKMAQQYCI